MKDQKTLIPISDKFVLTVEEAALYSHIGQNRITELMKRPRCPFVLFVGRKRLIKRVAFENFIAESWEI